MALMKISELRRILVLTNILGSYSMAAAAAFLGHLLALTNKPITVSAGRSLRVPAVLMHSSPRSERGRAEEHV